MLCLCNREIQKILASPALRQSVATPRMPWTEAPSPCVVDAPDELCCPITLELMRDPVQTLGRLSSERPSRTGSRHTRRILWRARSCPPRLSFATMWWVVHPCNPSARADVLRTIVEIVCPIYNPKYVYRKVEHMQIAPQNLMTTKERYVDGGSVSMYGAVERT